MDKKFKVRLLEACQGETDKDKAIIGILGDALDDIVESLASISISLADIAENYQIECDSNSEAMVSEKA